MGAANVRTIGGEGVIVAVSDSEIGIGSHVFADDETGFGVEFSERGHASSDPEAAGHLIS